MYQLIKQPEEQLRILFRNTAQKIGLHEAIVEKDFWVCLILDYLFHSCPWKEAFTFKGWNKPFQMLRTYQKIFRGYRPNTRLACTRIWDK